MRYKGYNVFTSNPNLTAYMLAGDDVVGAELVGLGPRALEVLRHLFDRNEGLEFGSGVSQIVHLRRGSRQFG